MTPAFRFSGGISMRTAFIGGGVMGEAMLARALATGVMTPADVCVAEPVDDRRASLASTHGVAVTADAAEAAAGAELVVLAVKPQQIAPVLEALAGSLSAGATAPHNPSAHRSNSSPSAGRPSRRAQSAARARTDQRR